MKHDSTSLVKEGRNYARVTATVKDG